MHRHYLEALFGGVEFPDGSFAIDYIDELIEHQKIFIEVVSDIRSSNIFGKPQAPELLLLIKETNSITSSKNVVKCPGALLL